MSKRRRRVPHILATLAMSSALATAPAPAFAQQRAVIGVLSPFVDADSTFLKDLRDGLAERGLREGQDIVIEHRSADGHVERLPEMANELVRLKVNVIVTASAPAIRFAQQATSTIPIVMARVGDAVDQGFVRSLAHPGGNITGISWPAPELSAKRLELMTEALPGMQRVGVLREASAGVTSVLAVQAAAPKLGIQPTVLEIRDPTEFATALSTMAAAKVDGIEILEGLMIFNNVKPLVALADQHKLPIIFPDISFVQAGGLMSYGPDFPEIHRRTADIVAKIIQGTPPGTLPVEQPTKFQFAINLKTAAGLGLRIAPATVSRADIVIE